MTIKRLVVLFVFIFFTGASSVSSAPPDFVQTADKAAPAVVNISAVKVVQASKKLSEDSPLHEFFERFFGGIPRPKEQKSLGSGMIWSPDGYIVTNNHVVANARQIKVNLQGGKKTYDAEIVGQDPATDLALLKIDADGLPTLKLKGSKEIQTGEWVLAIGNPFGLKYTVTAGIISAKGRVIGAGPYDDFLQTDASINPGNSGGPLLNVDGEVVGINTAIVATGQGIGFAVPSTIVKDVVTQLKKYKRVRRGWLGITLQDVDKQMATALGIEKAEGALVASVQPGSPAEKAGIRSGSVIKELNGQKIEDSREITRKIGDLPPGETVSMTLWHDGKSKKVEVTLGDRGKALQKESTQQTPDDETEALGIQLKPLSMREAQSLGLKSDQGLLVVSVHPQGLAAENGLKRGDVILKANDVSVDQIDEFKEALQKAKESGVLLLHVNRQGQKFFLTIPLKQ
ncbi:MAG: DegQ family serine endoprotease [Desulfohalobiaceae bacterium]|nr:DegQ family serine endoprotease [Desulfohalobiaceae bacterium]